MISVILRPATTADLPEINEIFNYYVKTSTCVWTDTPCSEKERKDWFSNHDHSLPILVADYQGTIVGWGALSWFESACTFSKTVENSVYIHHDYLHKRIGRTILNRLIQCARKQGLVSIIASISSDQKASIALHKSAGFVEAGQLQKVGYKFDSYRNLSYYQLLL